MTLNGIIIGFFIVIFAYSFVRPFASLIGKWFLRIASILGVLSIADKTLVNNIAQYVGVESGRVLLLYLSFITMFLIIFYSYERFAKLEKKLSKIIAELAIINEVSKKDDLNDEN